MPCRKRGQKCRARAPAAAAAGPHSGRPRRQRSTPCRLQRRTPRETTRRGTAGARSARLLCPSPRGLRSACKRQRSRRAAGSRFGPVGLRVCGAAMERGYDGACADSTPKPPVLPAHRASRNSQGAGTTTEITDATAGGATTATNGTAGHAPGVRNAPQIAAAARAPAGAGGATRGSMVRGGACRADWWLQRGLAVTAVRCRSNPNVPCAVPAAWEDHGRGRQGDGGRRRSVARSVAPLWRA